MIRGNQLWEDRRKASCQGHSLCRTPKAERSLGCSGYLGEVPEVGAWLVGGQMQNEVGKVGSG